MFNIKAFYSDPHFGHNNIIKYCNRPFNSIEDMNSKLIDNYNSCIGQDDTVIWLGDCFFKYCGNQYQTILNSLNGNKVLVLGNHDQQDNIMMQMGFSLVVKELLIKINNVSCRLSHYPYTPHPQFENPDKFRHNRPRYFENEFLLHGHDHNKQKVTGKNSINVGVDAWDYRPAMYDDVFKLITNVLSI